MSKHLGNVLLGILILGLVAACIVLGIKQEVSSIGYNISTTTVVNGGITTTEIIKVQVPVLKYSTTVVVNGSTTTTEIVEKGANK